MGQTVYVDLYFMINFSMDFLCFFLVSELFGTRLPTVRALLAAAIGGIYANVILFVPINGIFEILLDLLICTAMCITVFGIKKKIIIYITAYVSASAILGGFMTALFAFLNKTDIPILSVGSDGISAWLLVFLAILSGGASLLGGRFLKRKSSKKYTVVKIIFNGRELKLEAYCDSGNLLRDPISGRPCIVADADALDVILPKEIIDAAKTNRIGAVTFSDDIAAKIRLIPTRTATGDGILTAVRADKIFLIDGKDEREVNALLAICTLGSNNDGFKALVPAELMM